MIIEKEIQKAHKKSLKILNTKLLEITQPNFKSWLMGEIDDCECALNIAREVSFILSE